MMNVSVDAAVYGQDGDCGHVRYMIFNPSTWQLTHLGISQGRLTIAQAQIVRLAPWPLVAGSDPRAIKLNCTMDAFTRLPPFIRVHYIDIEIPPHDLMEMPAWTYPPPEGKLTMPVEQRRIPPGEEAISRETQVEAVDGHVGRFEQLVVNPEVGLITHLGFRRGHLWEQKLVIVPTAEIARIEADVIYLRLDKLNVTRLPSTPTRT